VEADLEAELHCQICVPLPTTAPLLHVYDAAVAEGRDQSARSFAFRGSRYRRYVDDASVACAFVQYKHRARHLPAGIAALLPLAIAMRPDHSPVRRQGDDRAPAAGIV